MRAPIFYRFRAAASRHGLLKAVPSRWLTDDSISVTRSPGATAPIGAAARSHVADYGWLETQVNRHARGCEQSVGV